MASQSHEQPAFVDLIDMVARLDRRRATTEQNAQQATQRDAKHESLLSS
jgi:hypothetical protein